MSHGGGSMAAIGAWTLMMVLMMLPTLSLTLWRYHRALRAMAASRPATRAAAFSVAYGGVWVVVAVVVFTFARAIGAEMQQRDVAHLAPFATSVVVLAAGAMQLTRWKTHLLRECRHEPASDTIARNTSTGWRDGARLGLHCTASCAGYTATLLVLGAMDSRAMFATTAAITAERVMPAGTRIARSAGVLALSAGVILLEHAILAIAAPVR